MDDTRKKKVGFCGEGIEGLSMIQAKDMLERADRTFNDGTSGIEIIPFRRASKDAREKAQIRIGISVNTAAVFGGRTGILADAAERTARGSSNGDSFRADEFKTFGPVFPTANPLKFQLRAVTGTKGDAGLVEKNIAFVGGVAGVHRDNGFRKFKFA